MKKQTKNNIQKLEEKGQYISQKEKIISNNAKNSNNMKEKTIINTIIPFQNLTGTNVCYINVIVQILYHSPFFKEELEKIQFGNTEKDKSNPLYQLKQLFLKYKKYQIEEKNEKSILNIQTFRFTLTELFHDVIANQSGDPIDILNILFNVIHLFSIKGKELNDKNSSSYKCENKCISHKLFPLKIKENLICSNCKKKKTTYYDNNYFIYEIFTFEILNYCDKLECKDFRNKIFDYSKKINSKIDFCTKINGCKCKTPKIYKELIQYEEYNPILIINLTWDRPIPLLTEICKMYTLIPQITRNSNIFIVDKSIIKDYYLYGLILYYNNHYINAIYIYEENLWYFCDDLKYRKFNSYKQLIDYLILNHIAPVILFYSIKPYDKEIDKDEVYHTIVYNEKYNKCMEIDKKNGHNPTFNYNICDSNLSSSVFINDKLNALENYKRNLSSNSKNGIVSSINNLNLSQLWYCPNCKKKNNINNKMCRICNRENEIDKIEVENDILPETIYSKDFPKLKATSNQQTKKYNSKQNRFLNKNIINCQEVKNFNHNQKNFKNDGKKVDMGMKYMGNNSVINEVNEDENSIKLKKVYWK